jgi:hypothetical protein
MLDGHCSHALPATLVGIAERYTLTDADTHKPYCVLAEAGDSNSNGLVDQGWGTVIVDAAATRELSHQMAEPLTHDNNMEAEAVTIFKRTNSRSFALPGTAPAASNTNSSCQGGFKISAAAHNSNTMFQATSEALLAHYGAAPFTVLQYDANTDCTSYDVFMTHGSSIPSRSTDSVRILKDNVKLAHAGWNVQAFDNNHDCSQKATDNVQGRLLNNVAASQVCTTSAADYGQRFIWIAQKLAMRDPADWIVPIEQTWP